MFCWGHPYTDGIINSYFAIWHIIITLHTFSLTAKSAPLNGTFAFLHFSTFFHCLHNPLMSTRILLFTSVNFEWNYSWTVSIFALFTARLRNQGGRAVGRRGGFSAPNDKHVHHERFLPLHAIKKNETKYITLKYEWYVLYTVHEYVWTYFPFFFPANVRRATSGLPRCGANIQESFTLLNRARGQLNIWTRLKQQT